MKYNWTVIFWQVACSITFGLWINSVVAGIFMACLMGVITATAEHIMLRTR
jgi:hypothetical protein